MTRWLPGRLKDLEGSWWVALWIVAVGVRVAIAIPLTHDWDGFVFTESARNLLDGVTPYAVVEQDPAHIYPRSDRPMVQQWYAYPALPLLAFSTTFGIARIFGLDAVALIGNLAIKLPFIAGDLVCAALVLAFLRPRGEAGARRAAVVVLFNPLLIWVSSAWGMFDVWIVNFLLLFLLALRKERTTRAGIFLALAPQVKLFPLLFLPVLLVYAFRRVAGRDARLRLLGSFCTVTVVLVAPFFVLDPRGFLRQNLLLHLERPPQGIGLAGMLDFVAFVRELTLPPVIPVLGLLTVAVVGLLNVWGVAFVGTSERRLFSVLTLIYAAVMLGNKVVNEQYFVVLVVLLLVTSRIAEETRWPLSAANLRRVEVVTTTFVFVASLLLGFHFLTFLPQEIAQRIGGSTDTLIYHLGTRLADVPMHTYPETFGAYYNLPITVALVAMLPVIGVLTVLVVRGTIGALLDLKRLIPTWSIGPRSRDLRWVSAGAVLVLVIGVAIPLSGVLAPNERPPPVDDTDATRDPRGGVGAFYYAWWGNASHRPGYVTDAWAKTTQTPVVGHYESKTPYYIQHVEQMQEAGIDFAVVSFHPYDRRRFHTFANHAEDAGFAYAPLLEPEEVLGDPHLRPQNPRGEPEVGFRVDALSAERLAGFAASVFPRSGPGPGWLRIDGKPVVFVFDAHHFFPSWDGPSRRELSDRVMARYAEAGADPLERISEAWGHTVEAPLDYHYPGDIHAFNNADEDTAAPSNDDFRRAFVEAYSDLWLQVRRAMEAKVGGPVYLVATHPGPVPTPADVVITASDIEREGIFDNGFAYSPAGTWASWRLIATAADIFDTWERQMTDLADRADADGRPRFQTVMPAFDDRVLRGPLGFRIPPQVMATSTYDRTWSVALANDADYVLVTSWNEFFEGTGIEPTVEYGDAYLDATRRWSEVFRRSVAEAGEGGVVEDAVARQ